MFKDEIILAFGVNRWERRVTAEDKREHSTCVSSSKENRVESWEEHRVKGLFGMVFSGSFSVVYLSSHKLISHLPNA